MPIDAATTTTAGPAAASAKPVDPRAFDRVVLPDLRERVRASLMFLAGAQTVYAVTILFVWPLLSMVALGVADSLFGFRDRFLRTRPPPLPTS